MNSEIAAYLNKTKPDFDSGFALFCRYSRNRIAMDWISRRHDFPKLLYELGKLRDTTVSVADTVPSDHTLFATRPEPVEQRPDQEERKSVPEDVRKLRIRTYDDRRTKRSELPPELQEVYDRNAEDYKLRRAFHEKMKFSPSSHDRAVFRSKVIETNARIQEGWKQIDAFFERQAAAQVAESFNESTFRSYVSKALRRERNSPKQVQTCRVRVRALLEHGCVMDDSTITLLNERGLL